VKISLFITCYNDTLFPETGKAVVRVLERLGHEVEFREAQTCCGQMHYNTGYHAEALPLVRDFLTVFEDVEIICVPSSSCVAMMRDHYPLIAEKTNASQMTKRVEALLPRVFEFTELLVERLGVTDVGAFFPHAVTLHPSCHSLRSLHIGERPTKLLERVQGLQLLPLHDADQCCGFGGTFAIKNPDVSVAMLSDKIRCVLNTGAEICTAIDNSCLMHIDGALSRMRSGVRCLHLAEILASTQSGVKP
jgi:L-lactate dehydrogenase complex protein LldE